MQPYIESYGIPFDSFQKLVSFSESIVSGSAALQLYLQQEGIEAGFEANDIDIYVPQTCDVAAFVSLLGESGYEQVDIKHSYPVDKYDTLHGIGQVITLANQERKIQLIQVLGVRRLLTWMFETFDLSCCTSWWSPVANRFHTLYPAETKERQMFHTSYNAVRLRTYPGIEGMHPLYKVFHERVLKYTARGFTLLEEAPVPLNNVRRQMDMYDLHMDRPTRLTGQKAFDVWAYEEVDCGEFLLQSMNNMLVYVGTQYYAFQRQSLAIYMREHSHSVPQLDKVYSTPYHQSVPGRAMQYFENYYDPIVELVPAFTVQSSEWQPRDISMFTVQFYTLPEWERGAPWKTVTPEKPVVYVPRMAPVALEPALRAVVAAGELVVSAAAADAAADGLLASLRALQESIRLARAPVALEVEELEVEELEAEELVPALERINVAYGPNGLNGVYQVNRPRMEASRNDAEFVVEDAYDDRESIFQNYRNYDLDE